MANTKRQYLGPIFKIGVVTAIVVILFRSVLQTEHIDHLLKANRLMIYAVLVNQLALILFALRMWWGLKLFSVNLGVVSAVRICCQSGLYYFLPFTVGMEFARYLKIQKALPDSTRQHIFAALIFDRLYGFFAAMLIALALLPFLDFSLVSAKMVLDWKLVAGVVTVALVMIGMILKYTGLRHQMTELVGLMASNKSNFLPYTLSALVMSLLTGYAVYLAAISLGIQIGMVECIFGVMLSMLLMLVPFTFFGAGLVEISTVAIFMWFGLSAADAVIIALLGYLTRFIGGLEGAIWELLDGGLSFYNKMKE